MFDMFYSKQPILELFSDGQVADELNVVGDFVAKPRQRARRALLARTEVVHQLEVLYQHVISYLPQILGHRGSAG